MMHSSQRMVLGIVAALALPMNAAWPQANPAATRAAAAEDGDFCRQTLHGQSWARTELYFGLSRADGPDISDEEFQDFLDSEVTPRFPDGLTLITGDGQFRGSSGIVVRERSKLLILFYPWSSAHNRAVERIRSIYKRELHQEAVLRVDATACVSF